MISSAFRLCMSIRVGQRLREVALMLMSIWHGKIELIDG